MTGWILPFGLFLLGHARAEKSCTKEDHRRCVSIADPLLKDPRLIFPDNIEDIDRVCRTWSSFVDCIKSYTEDCLSSGGRERFNAAIQVPIASVHQMCTVSTYQTEYLRHAPCMKATITEKEHCGTEYTALVDEVANKARVSKSSICCSHYRFRSCVLAETRKRCAGDEISRSAVTFSRQVLAKALSFLQEQCRNYIPNTGDCLDPAAIDIFRRSETSSSTALPDGYSGEASDLYTTLAHSNSAGVNMATEDTAGTAATTATPTSFATELTSTVDYYRTSQANAPLKPTARPASFGRAMSWTTPIITDSSSEIPSWATSTHQPYNRMSTKDELWYPPAGSFGGNHVDEPNQQGLSKNHQTTLTSTKIYSLLVVTLVLYVLQ